MPLYQIYHSYPLTDEQRQALASSITQLHCSAFATPSFFVHMSFIKQDQTNWAYFTAGKPRKISNRIVGIVRASKTRHKSDFDALGAKIENAWYEAIEGHVHETSDDIKDDFEAKRLLMVTFTPMLAVREAGMTIPEAGHEGAWLKDMMPFFLEMSEARGMKDFADMIKELSERDDLRALMD